MPPVPAITVQCLLPALLLTVLLPRLLTGVVDPCGSCKLGHPFCSAAAAAAIACGAPLLVPIPSKSSIRVPYPLPCRTHPHTSHIDTLCSAPRQMYPQQPRRMQACLQVWMRRAWGQHLSVGCRYSCPPLHRHPRCSCCGTHNSLSHSLAALVTKQRQDGTQTQDFIRTWKVCSKTHSLWQKLGADEVQTGTWRQCNMCDPCWSPREAQQSSCGLHSPSARSEWPVAFPAPRQQAHSGTPRLVPALSCPRCTSGLPCSSSA